MPLERDERRGQAAHGHNGIGFECERSLEMLHGFAFFVVPAEQHAEPAVSGRIVRLARQNGAVRGHRLVVVFQPQQDAGERQACLVVIGIDIESAMEVSDRFGGCTAFHQQIAEAVGRLGKVRIGIERETIVRHRLLVAPCLREQSRNAVIRLGMRGLDRKELAIADHCRLLSSQRL